MHSTWIISLKQNTHNSVNIYWIYIIFNIVKDIIFNIVKDIILIHNICNNNISSKGKTITLFIKIFFNLKHLKNNNFDNIGNNI